LLGSELNEVRQDGKLFGMLDTSRQLHVFLEFVSSGYGETPQENRLDFLEICAGSHRLVDAAGEYGMRATALDDTWFDAAKDI
jgi:hypothetical protein